MPDDFQVQPPADNGPPKRLPAYDRFRDINLRKPGGVRWAIIFAVMFAILALVLASFVSDGPSPATADSETTFDGTWLATAMTIDGEKVTGQVKLQMTASGRFRLDLPNKTQTGAYIARGWSIVLADDVTQLRFYAIYWQDGDTLTICSADAAYPTDFTAEKGSGRTLLVLKRLTKEP